MPHAFSCVTLNTRGLNNMRKRRQVFRWLHINKFQVIFLQETYSSSEIEKLWSAEWGGKTLFCHGSKHSKGTVIMFNPSLEVEIIEYTVSQKGRLIILEAQIDNTTYVFVNLYAPNDLAQQVNFFNNITCKLSRYVNENIIVGGDFNCALTPCDKSGGCPIGKKSSVIQAISNLCGTLDLKDVWRHMHPNEPLFTWQHKSLKIHCSKRGLLVSF